MCNEANSHPVGSTSEATWREMLETLLDQSGEGLILTDHNEVCQLAADPTMVRQVTAAARALRDAGLAPELLVFSERRTDLDYAMLTAMMPAQRADPEMVRRTFQCLAMERVVMPSSSPVVQSD